MEELGVAKLGRVYAEEIGSAKKYAKLEQQAPGHTMSDMVEMQSDEREEQVRCAD